MIAVGIPANARFQAESENGADNYLFDPGCFGIDRSDDLIGNLDKERLLSGATLI